MLVDARCSGRGCAQGPERASVAAWSAHAALCPVAMPPQDTKYVTLPELRQMMQPSSGLLWSPWFRCAVASIVYACVPADAPKCAGQPGWWACLEKSLA